jgi:glutathione-regulated potassium-efflux system ancillary protein KefG
MAESKNKILILYLHPMSRKSRINTAMVNAVSDLENVTVRHMYDIYPDFFIDVKAEQELLIEHDIIVWQHPFYWYSSPALLKEWIDLVLEHGFAYGRDGNALKGKQVITATTTGGRIESYTDGGYNHYSINQFLAPFERTAVLCKMQYLPPFIAHGTLLLEEQDIKDVADDYKKIIVSLRDKLFDEKELLAHQYINQILK